MGASLERLRQDAVAIYRAAIAGVDPGPALGHALAATPPPETVWLIAVGKAAEPMARSAVRHLARIDVPLLGGLVVTPDEGPAPDPRLLRIAGDHPVPGAGSFDAALALGELTRGVTIHDEVWVLLSGGASSLIGAPVDGLDPADYLAFVDTVGRAGLAIGELNRVRKRFSRWGAGRLAAALRAERIRVFALSDVPGDRPEDIGSGPCEPDSSTAAHVRAILESASLGEALGAPARWLEEVERGTRPETLKPGDSVFERRTTRVIGSNQVALDHAAAGAIALGYHVLRPAEPLEGEAAATGVRLGRRLREPPTEGPTAWLFGGETIVSLGGSRGRGGRAQELALAVAGELAARPDRAIVLLAAGTDGRDGPTDAAGALVDPTTWGAIASRGIDPARALAEHDAYPALDAAGALFRPGPTGTNVMDVVIGLTAESREQRAQSRDQRAESGEQ